jgi:hypothetical protein
MNCCRYQNSQVQRPFFFCYFWTDASSAESSINELCPTHVTQHVIVLCGFYLAIIRHCLSFFSLLDLTIATIIRGAKQLAVGGILRSVLYRIMQWRKQNWLFKIRTFDTIHYAQKKKWLKY